jgi:hypothetical protein
LTKNPTPNRVNSLAVWVYDRTGESMLVAMLMHASLLASALILEPLGLAVVPGLTYGLCWQPRCGSSLEWSPWPMAGISRANRSGGGWPNH